MKQKQNFKKMLHKAKLKSTGPRLAVLETLLTMKSPQTAQEIHSILKKDKIDLVTLYRTLATFEKNKLVRRIDLRHDAIHYELNLDHHHHIVCTDCGRVEDFKFCNMDSLIKKIVANASHFKNVQGHDFEIFGICDTCEKS
jgi:Fe2+ or Zn2+ uptake regulation protein